MKHKILKLFGISLILLSLTIAVLVYGPIHYKRLQYAAGENYTENLQPNTKTPSDQDNQTVKDISEVKPTGTIPASDKFGLVIPKIEVNVPVIANVSGVIGKEYYEKLKYGVAHQEGTPTPDKGGNTVIFGHSSAVPGVTSTQYSEAFLLLDKLSKGDLINLYYNKQKFSYTVESVREVPEGETSILDNTKEQRLTLFTCWPPGTDSKRLVVRAILAI